MSSGSLQLAGRLCEALQAGEAERVEALLKRGADPNLVLPEGIAAIHLAAGMEQESGIRCLDLLLRYGGDPNARSVDDLTPLHVAASWGCCVCLKLLLTQGGDNTLVDQDGNRAIDLAMEQGNKKCVQILEEAGEESSLWMTHRRAESFLSTLSDDSGEPTRSSRGLDSCLYPSLFSGTVRSSPSQKLTPAGPGGSSQHPLTASPKDHLNCGNRNSRDKMCCFRDQLPPSSRCFTFCDLHSQPVAFSNALFSVNKAFGAHTSNQSAVRGFFGNETLSPESETGISPNQSHLGECCLSASPEACQDGERLCLSPAGSQPRCCRANAEVPNTTGSLKPPRTSAAWVVENECKADQTLQLPKAESSFSLSQYSSFFDPALVVRATSQEGLDVTSPDHPYLFCKINSTTASDLENTVIETAFLTRPFGNPGACSVVGKLLSGDLEGERSSQYTSWDSEHYASAVDDEPWKGGKRKSNPNGASLHAKVAGSKDPAVQTPLGPWPGTSRRGTREHMELPAVEAALRERESPARSETARHFSHGPDSREASPKMCTNNEASGLPSTRKDEPAGNVGGTGIPWEELLAKDTSQERWNQGASASPPGDLQPSTGDLCSTDTAPTEAPALVRRDPVAANKLQSLCKGNATPAEGWATGRQSARGSELSRSPHAREEGRSQDTLEAMKCVNGSGSATLPVVSKEADDTLPVAHLHPKAAREEELSGLEARLRSMLLATKGHRSPLLQPQQSPCHVTPRSKSRITTSAMRNSSSSSSSSLFDESQEMPRRPRRVRSPEGTVLRSCRPGQRAGGLSNRSPLAMGGEEASKLEETELIASHPSSCKESSCRGSGPSEPPNIVPAGRNACPGDGLSNGEVDARLTVLERSERDEKPVEEAEEHGTDQITLEAVPSWASANSIRPAHRLPRPARFSFTRLSARGIPVVRLSTKHSLSPDSRGQEVPLSPGGRPVRLGANKPVDYLYVDEDKSHTFIERHIPYSDDSVASTASSEDTVLYDWRAYASQATGHSNQENAPLSPPPELCHLSDEGLAWKLRDFGVHPGPVTELTRNVYLQLLEKLMSDPKAKARKGPAGYSPELSAALATYQIPDGKDDEMALSRQFDQPDKSRKWREGLLKSSFNYLLLDPRVTQNLPFRCQYVSQAECFRTFISAIFYVGKGKRSRPYCHLYEALTRYKQSGRQARSQVCPKVQHIQEVWASGQGVISMHCFQNVIPVEAYTREACMVDAIGLKMLTNQKRGNYYGVVAGWPMKRRRCLGTHLLHRAMQIFLAEGERQLRPTDIRTGL